MADFDINGYLNRKLPVRAEDKIDAILKAKEDKLTDLRNLHTALVTNHAQNVALDQAKQASWVGKLGLDPDGIAGTAVNLGASAYAGVSRGAGDLLSLVPAASSFADESLMDEQDRAAYARYKNGKASPEDMVLLNQKKAPVSQNDTPEAKLRAQLRINNSPDALTTLQMFDRAEKGREVGRNIVESFNRQDVVHQDNREALRADLGDNFQSAWDQTGLSNLFTKDKEIGNVKDIAIGLGKLIYNAGDAAVSNPVAAAEYMAENLPQLVVGGAGKAGKLALTAMNAGYAADQYQQGIQNYQAKNNGAFPPEEERQRMAVLAASIMLAEQVGELGQLKAIGKVRKAADLTGDAVETGVVAGVKNTAKAGATGFVGEAATEAYQTYAEGEAQLKPVSAKDIYEGGVIGGISGGGLSAGGRALAEAAGATPEKAAETERVKTSFKDATDTGDVSGYLDPKSRDYSPSRAVAALYKNSQKEDATPESKQANLDKANEIVASLEEQQTKLEELAAATAPEALEQSKKVLAELEQKLATADSTTADQLNTEIAAAKEAIAESSDNESIYKKTQEKLTALNRDLESIDGHRNQLELMVKSAPADVDVQSVVDVANSKVDSSDATAVAATKTAIDQVITLSMAAPAKLTPSFIKQLVDNTDNSLTPEQRSYLRVLSEATVAENVLKSMDTVNNEVLVGSADGKNIGLTDYKERIATALRQNSTAKVNKLLSMLGNFAEGHAAKSAVVKQAYAEFKADGLPRRVERNQDGSWAIKEGYFVSDKERATNGGLNIGQGASKLVKRIPQEAMAIAKTQEALTQAVALKGAKRTVAPSTTPAAQATASPTPATPVVSVAPADLSKQLKKKDSYVTNPPDDYNSSVVVQDKAWALEQKTKVDAEVKRVEKTINDDSFDSDAYDALTDLQSDLRLFVDKATKQLENDKAMAEVDAKNGSTLFSTVNTPLEITTQIEQEIANRRLTKEDIKNELEHLETSEAEQTTESETEANTSVIEVAEVEQESTTGDTESAVGENADGTSTVAAGALEVLQDKSEETNNWLAQQVVQKAGNPDTGTQRPLVAVKNFLTRALNKESGVRFTQFLNNVELDAKQKAALTLLRDAAKSWFPKITDSLVRGYFAKKDKKGNFINAKRENPNFAFADLTQFLLQGENNKDLDLEENVKTAIVYAALRAINDMAGTRYNDDRAINAILGIPEYSYVNSEVKALLSEGQRENFWRNSVGKAVVQALGITATAETSADLIPRLESAMGAHVEKLLVGTGVLTRKVLTPEEMMLVSRPFTDKDGNTTDENGDLIKNGQAWILVSLARHENGQLRATAKSVVEEMAGSKSVLDKLFGVESAIRQPTLEPTEFKQNTAAKAQEGIPADIKEAVAGKQQEKNYMRDDLWRVVKSLDAETFLQMAGMTPEEQVIHKANELSVKAKNEGLVREYNHFMGFVKDTLLSASEVLGNVPFFYQYSVKRQQRVHIDNNGFNPQASKMHRYLTYRDSWKLDINFTDTPMVNNFLLRFAESMGVKTDAKMNAYTLQHIAQLYDPEADGHTTESHIKAEKVAAGIMVLQKLQESDNEVTLTSEEQDQLREAVNVGGEKIQSLAGLVEITNYLTAKANGDKSFTTYIQGEVDGKTNGPMLSQILFGGAIDVEDMKQRLRRGGFYFKDDAVTQFNEYRSQGGKDQYESIASAIITRVRDAIARGKNKAQFDAIQFFLKDLEKNNEILKAGRDLVKNPMTTIMFGSTMYSAVDKMADRLVERIYATMVEVAEKSHKADIKTALGHLRALIPQYSGAYQATTVEEVLSTELTKVQLEGIKQTFHKTFGNIAQEAMEVELVDYLKNRDLVNDTANSIFSLSNALSNVIRDQYVAELLAAGKIKERKGKMLADLTKAQQRELDKRLDALVPRVHTVGSRREGNVKNGVRIGKTKTRLSINPVYSSVIQFGTPVSSQDNTYSFTAASTESYLEQPGTGTNAKQVHSLDSDISHAVQKALEVLNVHDALLGGLKNFTEMGQRLNEATWNSIVEYSPIAEMRDTLISLVYGINNTITSKNVELTEDFKRTLAKELAGIDGAIRRLNEAAYKADKLKYETMLEMASVDQYTLEGGAFQVTAEHTADVQKRLDNLSPDLPLDVYQAVDTLKELSKEFAGPETNTRSGKQVGTSPFGTLLNQTEGDTRMQDAISKRGGKLTGTQAVNMLRVLLPANSFNRELLEKVAPLLGEGLTINLITRKDTEADVLEMPDRPSSAWYVSKGKTEAIYMLAGSFRESNMTAEVLLHELVHAATAQTVRNPSKEAKTLIAELETLRSEAKAVVESDASLNQFLPAVESLDELIAWGMTNRDFQVKVLTRVQMPSKTQGNRLLTGLKVFIETLSKLLFRNPTKQQTNGMTILVTNVAGLLNPEAKAQGKAHDVNQSMAAAGLSTLDIHNALNDGKTSPAFSAHLESLLTGIVNSIHGPWGTLKDMVEKTSAKTPLEVFNQAEATGVIPFASDAVKGGFRITAQESFAIDQVEATVRAALDGNEAALSAAYTELGRLFNEARNKLKEQDFSKDPQKQALFDFVFTSKSNANGRSDFLSRFASLGLAHQEFRSMLEFGTEIDRRTLDDVKGIPAKLVFLFNKFMNFFSSKVTHTYSGQPADAKLTTLVEQLVSIETKRLQMLSKPKLETVNDTLERMAKTAGEKIKAKIGDFGESDLFQRSSNEFVKLVGNTLSIVGHDRADQMIETIAKYRDYLIRDKQGLVAGLITEVRGAPELFQRMLRGTKSNEKARKNVMSWTSKNVRESFLNQEMTDEQKKAITNVFLRTDMASLLKTMDMEDLVALLDKPTKLDDKIKDLESQLSTQFGSYANYFKQAAEDLGYYMVTGIAVNQNLMRNASNIANMNNTVYAGKLNKAQAAIATGLIDQLVSLRALTYVEKTEKAAALEIFKQEVARTDDGNGISTLLNTHLQLQKDSRERLFSESESLMLKGYLPEVTDPNVDVKVVTLDGAQDLLDQGYKQVGEVMLDPKDYNQQPKAMFVLQDGGLSPHTTGIMSLTSMQQRGTEMFMASRKHQQMIAKEVRQATMSMFSSGVVRKANTVKQSYAVPVMSPTGKLVSYNYTMKSKVRDDALRRDNRFDELLGTMAGATLDKEISAKQNADAIKALKDFYEADISEHPDSYLLVGPKSTDPELREIWDLLPDATKAVAAQVWGENGMMVRNDLLNINFGYRKFSIADLWESESPNVIQHQFMKFVEAALYLYARTLGNMSMDDSERYKKRAAQVTRRVERMWQEVVHEMKDIIVMKTGTVMIGNILSNVSVLVMNGVPFIDIVKSHRTALAKSLEFQNDQEELYRLEQLLATGQTNGKEKEIKINIVEIKDRLSRNPVRELMEAGLMPSIVEDVAAEEDIYSFKSEFIRRAEKLTSKLNPTVIAAGRTVYMAHDTQLYKWLNHTTQLSDFVARYTLYQHLTTKKDALSKAVAIQEASDTFVNYDIPSHRTLQYLDDMGIFMFTKYFLRIQKVLLKLTREHPTRVFGMLAFDYFFNLMPMITDASVLQHFGNNPFHTGAFQFPTVLDDLATVHAGLQIIK